MLWMENQQRPILAKVPFDLYEIGDGLLPFLGSGLRLPFKRIIPEPINFNEGLWLPSAEMKVSTRRGNNQNSYQAHLGTS
jgi:hypothetical protein